MVPAAVPERRRRPVRTASAHASSALHRRMPNTRSVAEGCTQQLGWKKKTNQAISLGWFKKLELKINRGLTLICFGFLDTLL